MFFFFKWVRISPEIDWYHYQGASPALNNDKDPYELSVTSEPSVGGGVRAKSERPNFLRPYLPNGWGGQRSFGQCPKFGMFYFLMAPLTRCM